VQPRYRSPGVPSIRPQYDQPVSFLAEEDAITETDSAFENTASTASVGADSLLSLSGAMGQGKELQFGHREMLPIVGKEPDSIDQSDSSDGDVGIGECLASFLPLSAQQPGFPGDLLRDGTVLKTVHESGGFFFFARAQSGIHFSEVYRATGKNVALIYEPLKKLSAAESPVEMVENDG
jgi:hypothetical protein